ncbi:MAG: hypothetical protein ABIQ64_03885 [Candidatus Saccharimonadales bacterium]
MSEISHEQRVWRKIDYTTKVGGCALDMTVFAPLENNLPGFIIPIPPGLASKRRVYDQLAQVLASDGHIPVLIGHEGASDDGVRAITYALQSIEHGSFAGQSLPIDVGNEIILNPHSLGARKTVKSMKALRAAGDSRIQHVVLEASACLGGVNKLRAPLDAAHSIAREMHYVRWSGVVAHHEVALDALSYIRGLGLRIATELYDATWGSIERDIAELQSDGVSFAAVDHPDDLLVSSYKNQQAYHRLGIPHTAVDAPYAGHNAQLYHSRQTADAIYRAHALLRDNTVAA